MQKSSKRGVKQAEAEKERKREERCANMGKEGREKEGVQELNVV